MLHTTGAKVVGPDDGKTGTLGTIGVRFMVDGEESGGGFSLVEHPMPARYELEMDPGSIPGLVARFGLRAPGDTA